MQMRFQKEIEGKKISVLLSLGLFMALAAGLMIATLLFDAQDKTYLFATFTEEHVRMLGMFDNRGQQAAYRVFLGLAGLLALAAWYSRPFPTMIQGPHCLHVGLRRVDSSSGIILFVTVIGLVLLQRGLQPGSSMYILQGQYGIGFLPSAGVQLALMAAGVLAIYLVFLSSRVVYASHARRIGILAVIAVAVYAVTTFLFGTQRTPDFHSFTPGLLTGIEWHYAGSVATADRLALGDRIGEIAIHAGLLPSAVLGYWQTAFGMLDFGGHIRFIAYLQLVFFLIAVAAYAKWYSKRWLPIVIAVLLVLPWVTPIHAAVLYPNQSAWRFLGLGFGVLVLVYLHERQIRDIAGPLGLAAGLALLWNLETGFAVALAYVGFLVVRATSESGSIRLTSVAARFSVGFVSALMVFFCVIRLAFGYWIDLIGVIQSFPLLGGFAKGYGGLQLKQIEPLAALIFIHALYVFVSGIVRWGSGVPVSARKACEMALGGLILLWGAYYFKGPHFWNLWSYKFLYGFFIGHLLLTHWPPKPRRFVYFGRLARLVAFAIVVFPALVTSNLLTARSLSVAIRQMPCISEHVVSGLCIPGDLARAVSNKSATLKMLSEREDLLFLSANSYLMPLLTGINQPLQMRDAFSETILKSDFDRLVRHILSVRPSRILFDDPESLVSGYPAHRQFYARVRAAVVAEYLKENTMNGWEIWRLRFPEQKLD